MANTRVKKKKKIVRTQKERDRAQARIIEIVCIVVFIIVAAITTIDYFFKIF